MKSPVVFILGLFFGLIIGVFVTMALTATSADEEPEQEAATQQPSPHGGSVPQAPGGQDQPPRQPPGGHGSSADQVQQSIAKVHFMKKFVAALTALPQNDLPNPGYEALVKEGAAPIRCADCHDQSGLNVESMVKLDPGSEAVESYRHQPRFMIPLMIKWVERLNQRHGDRLRKPITCTDCHAIDPRESWDALPPLMVNFVKALKERPANMNPAKNWKPLLKDPSADSMLCGVCHGETGERMEANLAQLSGTRMQKYTENKAVMITLMEHWMEKLNRNAKDLLVKAVACIDCHEVDPRK